MFFVLYYVNVPFLFGWVDTDLLVGSTAHTNLAYKYLKPNNDCLGNNRCWLDNHCKP